jgi:hypothetical protein
MHHLAALGLTPLMAAAIVGLGAALGGKTTGDRWVRGWTAAWWSVALVAQVAGPRPSVWVGFAVLGFGLARALPLVRERPRAALMFAVGLAAGAPLWLLPPYFYDALVYHLGLPWTWLANRSFAIVPHNLFSDFPAAASTLFLLPVAAGVPEAAAGLHWATFVVALVALARLAARLGADRYRWVAPLLLVGCWHATWIASVPAADQLVLLGIVVMMDHLVAGDEPRRARIVGAGLAFGLAIAAKYTAAIPAAAVLAAGAVAAFPVSWWAAVVGVAASSFWWVRNVLTTGNPVFPLMWSIFGGRGWSAADDQRYLALVREGVGGLASVPAGLVHLVAPPIGLGWWVLAVLPLVAFALGGRGAARERRLVAFAAALALAGWLVTSQTTRYALPLAALVAALAAAGLGRMAPRPAGLALATLGVAVALGVLSLAAFLFGVLHVGRVWSGAESAEAWRHSVTLDDPLPAYRRCAALPRQARVLVVGEGRSWGCPRPHQVSSPYDEQLAQDVVENSASAAAAARRLRAEGFTDLLINWGEVARLGGPGYRVLRWQTPAAAARWGELLARFTTPVFRDGEVEVRALAAGPAAAAPAER